MILTYQCPLILLLEGGRDTGSFRNWLSVKTRRNKEAIATRLAGSRPFSACTCQCLTGSRVTLFPSSGCASPRLCMRTLVYDFTCVYADVRFPFFPITLNRWFQWPVRGQKGDSLLLLFNDTCQRCLIACVESQSRVARYMREKRMHLIKKILA